MRVKCLLHRCLILVLGVNLLAAGMNASAMMGDKRIGEERIPVLKVTTTDYGMMENCHDKSEDADQRSNSKEFNESCCDEPCDCNGPTCGGASLAGKSLHAPWNAQQSEAIYSLSLYMSLDDGPQSPPPISHSI